MKPRAILVTTGVSLIQNYRNDAGRGPAPDVWAALDSLREKGAADPTLGEIVAAASSPRPAKMPVNEQALAAFLQRSDPARASAETNGLRGLAPRAGDRLVFLHSETDEGRLCAAGLRRYYAGLGCDAEVKVIEHLRYDAGTFRVPGLRSLIKILMREIRASQERGYEVVITATGGFKAETAYATLVGLLHRVPVYYVHEKFNEPVRLPPLPIAPDPDFWRASGDVLLWLLGEARPYDEWKQRDPEGHLRMLLDEIEESGERLVSLSPAGEFFCEISCLHAERHPPEVKPRSIVVRSVGDHSTLWDVRVERVEDVPDADVRDLILRIAEAPGVHQVQLAAKREVGRAYKPELHARAGGEPGSLPYEIRCSAGIQEILILCEPGKEAAIRRNLGSVCRL